MAELIDRKELRKFPIRIDHYDKENGSLEFVLGIETVFEYIEYLPTIEAKPVVHSYWLHMVSGFNGMEDPFMCDNCCYTMEAENIMNNHDALRYCSSCGARMDYVDTSGGKMKIEDEDEE